MTGLLWWALAFAFVAWAAWRVGFAAGRSAGERAERARTEEARQTCRNAAWIRAGYHRVAVRPLSGAGLN